MPHVPDHVIDEEFTPQDASVTGQLSKVLATDSPLITRARTRAAQAANRRGLLNTSLAIQAGEAAALDVALPIASQQAGQIHQTALAGGQIASTERLAGRQIASTEGLVASELGSRAEIQAADIASREALTRETLASQEQTTAAEIAGRQAISESGIAAQERIAASSSAAFDREKATAAIALIDASYQQAFATVGANTDIPAETREAYLTHLAAIRDTNFELVEQMYNIDLVWATPTIEGTAPTPTTAPTGGTAIGGLLGGGDGGGGGLGGFSGGAGGGGGGGLGGSSTLA